MISPNKHSVQQYQQTMFHMVNVVCDIGKIASTLGVIQKYYTLIHALWWCNTTPAMFWQGKLSILRLFPSKNKKRSLAAREAADVFCDSNATPEQIAAAGLRIFVVCNVKKIRTTSLFKIYENGVNTFSSQTKRMPLYGNSSMFSFSSCLLLITRMKLCTWRRFKCNQLELETSRWSIDTSSEEWSACPRWDAYFKGRNLHKVKNVRNFRDKISWITRNNTFRKWLP